MAEDVEVTLSHPWDGHEVGDRIAVDPDTAQRLVVGGVALYATKADAKAAGGDPDSAATSRKK